MAVSCWRIEAQRAWLETPQLKASIDLARPSAGLLVATLQGPAGNVLGVELPGVASSESPKLADFYQRGDDLIATYEESPAWPLRTQIYWRNITDLPQGVLAGVELQVSVNTSLLDSRPELTTCSLISSCDAKTVDHGDVRYVLSRAAGAIGYAEMVHPADESAAELTASESSSTLRHRLFTRPLEKGVILRSRILGLWISPDADQTVVARAYQDFAASKPPLTT